MAMAGSAFSCVAQKFIQGDITIKILNRILEREDAFTELLQIGNHSNLPDKSFGFICMLQCIVTSKILVQFFILLKSWYTLSCRCFVWWWSVQRQESCENSAKKKDWGSWEHLPWKGIYCMLTAYVPCTPRPCQRYFIISDTLHYMQIHYMK